MRSPAPFIHLLFGLSGVAGLGYQVVWTRTFAVGLGHEMPGLLAVVTAFFVGLALGGLALDRVVSASRVPGRWYAGLEFVIGAWAVLIAILAPWLNEHAARLIGPEPPPLRQWGVAFALPLVALLPATAAMGATLPAVERLASRLAGRGSTVAGLYAANTLGAMLGIVATATVMMPWLGMRGTVLVLAGVNLACGAGMWLGPAAGERARPPVTQRPEDPPPPGRLGVVLFATGLLGIGFEVAGVRVIAQVLENTVYTYATTVAVFLGGTAIGAGLWQRFGTTRSFATPAAWLVSAVGLGMVLGTAFMPAATEVYEGVRTAGAGPIGRGAASILGELAVAALVFGPATIAMGATFSHLVQSARDVRRGVGIAAGLNTLGGALAPFLVGVLLIPGVGTRWTLALLAAGELLLVGALPRAAWRRELLLPGVIVLGSFVVMPTSLVLVTPPPGMRLLPQTVREGVMATVAVAEDDAGDRVLKVNDQFNMGGTKHSFADRRQAHIPLLLHPAPERALFLGVGSGLTAGAATLHGDLHVTAVELVPEVVELLPAFSPANRWDAIDRIVVADARRFVRADDAPAYDVIVADLFHPARDGAGSLYTLEHFAAVRSRLAPGGLFCQWLPLYQLDAPVVAIIVRTFLEVFPRASGWIAQYNADTPFLGLIGRDGAPPDGHPWAWSGRDGTWLSALEATRSPALEDEAIRLALVGPIDLVACRMLDAAGLRALAAGATVNRDDRPAVTFAAPWYTYAFAESGRERMLELLAGPRPRLDLDDGVLAAVPAPQIARVTRFLDARDLYLKAHVARLSGDAAAARAGLLDAVTASLDFGTAYTMAVQDALTLAARGERDEARALLRTLIERRPERREAREALGRLAQ